MDLIAVSEELLKRNVLIYFVLWYAWKVKPIVQLGSILIINALIMSTLISKPLWCSMYTALIKYTGLFWLLPLKRYDLSIPHPNTRLSLIIPRTIFFVSCGYCTWRKKRMWVSPHDSPYPETPPECVCIKATLLRIRDDLPVIVTPGMWLSPTPSGWVIAE